MGKAAGVSVVIPNYNGIAYIEACLEALYRDMSVKGSPRTEVIVVDNASDDGSRELVAERFPDVKVVALDQNYGFAAAVNAGIRSSREPFVILLNNDTEVLPGFTKALYRAAVKDKKAFAVQAKLLSMKDPSKIDDAGDLYCALGWAFARGKDGPARLYEEKCRIFAACAGAAIYRKKLFDTVGYFDEAHFAYLEDIDICWRARLKGYRSLYEPAAKVLHAGSGASGSRHNEFKVRLSSRNSVWLAYKNMPAAQLIINAPFLFAGFIIKYIFFLGKGLGGVYARGVLEGIRTCRGRDRVLSGLSVTPVCLEIQAELFVNVFKRFKVS